MLIRFWLNVRGATAIEYCLIAGIVSIAVVLGASSIGTKLRVNYLQPVVSGLS